MITYEVPGMVFFAKTGEYGVGDGEITHTNIVWANGSDRLFPQDPRLISCGKKFVAIAYGM
jgi:hypothetical protein